MNLVTNYHKTPLQTHPKNNPPSRKWDASGNPINEEHIKPILETGVYKLEFPCGRVDEYAINIIIDNLIDQVDDQGRDTGILEEIASFRHDTDVDIPTREKSYANVNGIQIMVINT